MNRRYFIIDKSQAKIEPLFKALEMCIGKEETQRYSLDNRYLFIKTTEKQLQEMLSQYSEYTLEQILELTFTVEYTKAEALIELQKPTWQNEEPI